MLSTQEKHGLKRMTTFPSYSHERNNVRDSGDVGQKLEQVKVWFTILESRGDVRQLQTPHGNFCYAKQV